MVNIETYKFNKDVVEKLKDTKFGNRWPVVYIINNKKRSICRTNYKCIYKSRPTFE